MTQLDILGVVFGLLAAISGLLRGASFTRVDREKYRTLKKLDGKKLPLFISTFAFLILAAVTQIIQVTTNPSSRFQTMVVDRQSNIGISDVKVKLLEVDGKQADETKTTAPDGRFVFKVAAEAGTKIRLSFDHPQYRPYNDYYETENAETIKLERKVK